MFLVFSLSALACSAAYCSSSAALPTLAVNFYKFPCHGCVFSVLRATCLPFSSLCLHVISDLISTAAEGGEGRARAVRSFFLFFFYLSVSCHVQQNAFNMFNALLSLSLLLLLCVRLQECKFNLVNWNNLLHATKATKALWVHWKGDSLLGRHARRMWSTFKTDFRLSIFFLHFMRYDSIYREHMKWRLETCQFTAAQRAVDWNCTLNSLCILNIYINLFSKNSLHNLRANWDKVLGPRYKFN